MGRWTYAYDVLAELTSQTDAKKQTTSLTYDLLPVIPGTLYLILKSNDQ